MSDFYAGDPKFSGGGRKKIKILKIMNFFSIFGQKYERRARKKIKIKFYFYLISPKFLAACPVNQLIKKTGLKAKSR